MSSRRRIGVICAGDDGLAVGGAVANGMVAACGTGTGVLAVVAGPCRTPTARAWVPAGRTARRLAASLALREVPAWPRGRVVVAWLDDDPDVAAAQAGRVDAAAGPAPVVTLVGGARCAATDGLLRAQDATLVVVPAGAPQPLRTLAAAEPGARVLAAGVPAVARALALTGMPILPAVRRVGRQLGGDVPQGRGAEGGQALLVMLGALLLTLTFAIGLGAVALGLGRHGDQQRAADLAALAAARSMADDYADVVEPLGDGRGGHAAPGGRGADPPVAGGALGRAAYLTRARALGEATGRRNGAAHVIVTFPGTQPGEVPLRVAATVTDDLAVRGAKVAAGATALAEVVPPAVGAFPAGAAGAGQYTGPLEHRDGKPMRPDVARAYDRMAAAARAGGVSLVVVSGFRSDAEQAVLFARHPDPKWVAPPGRSLHRLGTELDLGPAAAYGWLARHAKRFGFVQRYAWEDWHYGYVRNAGSASLGYRARAAGGRARGGGGDGGAGTGFPAWVPERYRAVIARAAQRWNVGAVLLAAQLEVESGFDPAARSSAGAQGIAQFMPGTARLMGLRDPWDAAAAIDAQAHLMRNLLRRFAAVPLALAAYNAGEGAVMRCRCAGPYAETRAYVAKILALVLGTGDATGLGAAQMTIRLVQ